MKFTSTTVNRGGQHTQQMPASFYHQHTILAGTALSHFMDFTVQHEAYDLHTAKKKRLIFFATHFVCINFATQIYVG